MSMGGGFISGEVIYRGVPPKQLYVPIITLLKRVPFYVFQLFSFFIS